MKTPLPLKLAALALAAVCSLLPSARAVNTLQLILDSSFKEVQQGTATVLTFTADAIAPAGNSAAIFLNGDSFNISAPLTLDDSDFFNVFPISLSPGQSFDGALFTVTVPATAPTGTYNGEFDLLGGADGNASNTLATVHFQVAVPETTTSLALLSLGLAALAGFALVPRHQRQRAN